MSIQFIDSKSTLGFQVRVGPRHATLTKFFAVRKHGGKKKALAAAREAEKELQAEAEPITPRAGPRSSLQANNTSGVTGIRPRRIQYTEPDGIIVLYFVASWSSRGKACSTSYSTERHGLLPALTMAMERRAKATGVPYDITPRQALKKMQHLI